MVELFAKHKKFDIDSREVVAITYAITDINDIGSITTEFSKTVTLVGTAKNSQMLGYFFEPSKHIAKDVGAGTNANNLGLYFNPQKSISIQLYYHQVLVLDGSMKLLKVLNSNGALSYEVMLYGNLGAFIYELRHGKNGEYKDKLMLQDLYTIDESFLYSAADVSTIWGNGVGSSFVAYPYIDYGNNSLPNYRFSNVRPAYFVRDLIALMAAKTSFEIDTSALPQAYYSRLVVPNNQEVFSRRDTKLLRCAEGIGQSVQSNNVIGLNQDVVIFSNTELRLFATTATPGVFEYTNPSTANITITLNCDFANFADLGGLFFRVSNASSFTDYALWQVVNTTIGSTSLTATLTINQNDLLAVMAFAQEAGPSIKTFTVSNLVLEVQSTTPVSVPVFDNDTLYLHEMIPQGIYCDEFLISFLKMHNLYCVPDKYSKKIKLIPYYDMYNLSNRTDWSAKLDRSNYELIPSSQVMPNVFKFRYKEDSDHLNERYKKTYNIGFGDYDRKNINGGETAEIEVIFSATPTYAETDNPIISGGIFGLDTTTNDKKAKASNIRILQISTLQNATELEFVNHLGANWITAKDIPVATMYDHPLVPTNGNYFETLCFGTPHELYYSLQGNNTLSVSLYSSFWSEFVGEVTDGSCVILKGKFNLSALEIHNLDYSKIIQIDGVAYRLQAIEDFDMGANDLAKCTLIKVVDIKY